MSEYVECYENLKAAVRLVPSQPNKTERGHLVMPGVFFVA